MSSAAHHPALCLLDVWLDLLLGLLGIEPSSLLLESGVEQRVCVCVCVCVCAHACMCGWEMLVSVWMSEWGGCLVLHACN